MIEVPTVGSDGNGSRSTSQRFAIMNQRVDGSNLHVYSKLVNTQGVISSV